MTTNEKITAEDVAALAVEIYEQTCAAEEELTDFYVEEADRYPQIFKAEYGEDNDGCAELRYYDNPLRESAAAAELLEVAYCPFNFPLIRRFDPRPEWFTAEGAHDQFDAASEAIDFMILEAQRAGAYFTISGEDEWSEQDTRSEVLAVLTDIHYADLFEILAEDGLKAATARLEEVARASIEECKQGIREDMARRAAQLAPRALARHIYSSAETYVTYYHDAVGDMIAELAPEPEYVGFEFDEDGCRVSYRFDDARPEDEDTRKVIDTLADELAGLRATAYGYRIDQGPAEGVFDAAQAIINELQDAEPFTILENEGIKAARAAVDQVLAYDRLTPDLEETREWLTRVAAERAADQAAEEDLRA